MEKKSETSPENEAVGADGPDHKCSLCQQDFASQADYDAHISSREHVIKSSVKSKMSASIVVTYSKTANDPRADAPELPTTNQSDGLSSEGGAQAVPESDEGTATETPEKPGDKQKTTEDKNEGADSHEERVEAKVLADKETLKDTGDQGLCCQVCDMQFSGPVPYMQHMKSTQHEKQLRKKNYKEKLEKLQKEDEDISPFENNIGYYCKLCMRAFSGEEGAFKHMIGKNHARVKRRQRMLKEIKAKIDVQGDETDGAGNALEKLLLLEADNEAGGSSCDEEPKNS